MSEELDDDAGPAPEAFILGVTPFDDGAIRVFAERMTEAQSLGPAPSLDE